MFIAGGAGLRAPQTISTKWRSPSSASSMAPRSLLPELSPSLGTRHCGVELNVENVPPPTADLNLGKVRVTVVG